MEKLYREKGIDRLEYYGRLMDWHTKWTANKRPIYHLTVYRWPLVKQLAEWRRHRSARAHHKHSEHDAVEGTFCANVAAATGESTRSK
jgi:hypothetical protein